MPHIQDSRRHLVESRPRAGTQSIERTVRILTALAARVPGGWRLPDLARHCDLDRGTVRRILGCLVRERLALHRTNEQRYLPGPLLFELGLGLPGHGEMQRAGIAALEQLAIGRDTGRFLCFRSGMDLVCAGLASDFEHGYSLHVGARRSLASSAAGIAMLVTLPAQEATDLFEECLRGYERGGGQAAPALRTIFRNSLAAGFGINEGELTPGWNSYAVAVRNRWGAPVASLMVTAAASQLPPERVAAIRRALAGAAATLERGKAADLG